MASLRIFVAEEMAVFRQARSLGRRDEAWAALERAHVLSQQDPWLHTRVHWAMLRYGLALNHRGEVRGQVARLAVAGIGSLLGKAPAGNTGRSDVPIMAVMPIAPEIARKLEMARRPR